jgi:hypothetical protein
MREREHDLLRELDEITARRPRRSGGLAVLRLTHKHEPGECRAAFGAWKGFNSPLRPPASPAACIQRGHRVWWRVEARDAAAALAQLPPFVAERTVVEAVDEVKVP